MEGFLKALENGIAYDYICNHGHELSNMELCDIVKEYIYAIDSMGLCDGKEDLIDAVYENLTERCM